LDKKLKNVVEASQDDETIAIAAANAATALCFAGVSLCNVDWTGVLIPKANDATLVVSGSCQFALERWQGQCESEAEMIDVNGDCAGKGIAARQQKRNVGQDDSCNLARNNRR
jgi:hypothetical protein